jgi:hypothetical protein
MEGLNDRCGFIKVAGPHDVSIKNENVQRMDSQRESMFSNAFSAIESRRTGTELVLERLRGLSQSAAMCFESKAQQMKKFVFRLLFPHGLSLNDKPSYIALSYRWPDRAEEASQLDQPKAAVGGFALPIPPLLYGALVKELHSRSEGIWCDQICIDQNNKAEIAVSIGLMDVIYQEARCVAIALTDVLISKEEQDWLQKYIPDYLSIAKSEPLRWRIPHRGEEPPYLEKNPIFYGIYWKIVESDYFQRAWCSHEMRMGKEHIFFVPCADEENVFRFDGPFLVDLLMITAGVPHNRITDGIICTEDVIMGLAPHLEQQQARDLVYKIRRQARNNGRPLIDLLVENEKISSFLDRAALVQFMSVPLRSRVHNTIVASITGARIESVGDLLEPFHNVSELGVGGDQALPEFERKSSARRELHDALLKTFDTFSKLVTGGDPHLPEYKRRINAIWDKISMTLHVARLDVVVRYETYSSITNVDRPSECTQKLALLSLAANEPSLLCTSGEPLACSSSSKSRSWIRAYADGDSSARGSFDFTQHIMDSPSIALSPNDAGLYIELKLCGFKQIITSAGPANWAGWRAQRLVRGMIETEAALHPGERYYNWRNFVRLNEETQRLLVLTVACVLQNGILWILKSLSFDNGDIIFGSDLRTAFQPYIDCGFPGFEMPPLQDEKTTEETIMNWVRTVEGSQAAQAILQFVTSILYKTLPKPWRADLLKPYNPFIISTNANKYIMLGGTELRNSTLAVPKALIPDKFSGLRRVWLLDFATIDGKRQVTLLGRQRLFGPSICDDIVEWEGLKKIYGPVASCVE